MNLALDVAEDSLIDSLSEKSHEEVLAFIKKLDAAMQDYDFTLQLAKHFVAELKAECEATKEPFQLEELLAP